jgi:DNA-binding beta-propeller fold protein YncE
MAHRVRGLFANTRALANMVVRVAVGTLGNGAARRYLESPSWGATEVPPEAPILDVPGEEIEVPGCPFDVAPTADGGCVFVSVHEPGGSQRTPGKIAALHWDGGALLLRNEVTLPAAPWGLALTRQEALLAVANSHGVALLDARAARSPGRDAIVGIAHYGRDLQTIRVLESTDGRWLFASDEHNRTVSILDLRRADGGAFDASALVGQVPVDLSPLGIAESPDGRFLYVTCEMIRVRAPDLVNWFVWAATLHGHLRRAGVLIAIDLGCAMRDPANAVAARTPAGGHPVRLSVSRDRQTAWVTARASNQLLAYSLGDSGAMRQIAAAPVGPAPVGLTVLDDLGVVLVANSNRFGSEGRRETLAVMDIARMLEGRPACLGHIRVGSFPREVVADRVNGRVYVTNFVSGTISVFSLAPLADAVQSARTR